MSNNLSLCLTLLAVTLSKRTLDSAARVAKDHVKSLQMA